MRLLLRADADACIGIGHLMRCLALAQAWQRRGGAAGFLTCAEGATRERIEREGFAAIRVERRHPDPMDLAVTLEALGGADGAGGAGTARASAWLVLDGYVFDAPFQQRVLDAGHRLLVIDDSAHLPQYHATLLLNQNIGADSLVYTTDPRTQRLLGPRFALLREEFVAWRAWKAPVPALATQVLVTLGGSDTSGTTSRVLDAIVQADVPGVHVTVVAGGGNPHRAALENQFRASGLNGRVVYNAGDMASLMAEADLAVSAAGSTCWELAFMRVPSILLVTADNQVSIARGMAEAGAAENLGPATAVTVSRLSAAIADLARADERRRGMSEAGRDLVDGLGSDRVASVIEQYTDTN